jgi:orotidine-5'-phosphate decarboxylase
MQPEHKIFCAIDIADWNQAYETAKRVAPYSHAIKLGMTFFNQNGVDGVKRIMDDLRSATDDVSLFLDLKLHDIPMQVAGAVRPLIRAGAEYLTIHCSGGAAMMRATSDATREEADKLNITKPRVLGITVLTSLDDEALGEVGQAVPAKDQVLKLAKLAQENGLDGVVCSPQEVALIRGVLPPEFDLVVPGIRPKGAEAGDQKRVMTPYDAIKAGASHLVIGRPITGAQNPAETVSLFYDEMRAASMDCANESANIERKY